MRAEREDRISSERARPRRTFLAFSAALLLIVFAAFILTAYFYGQRQSGTMGAPPIVRADRMPYKSVPDDEGGIDIPHQDKRIFDLGREDETADVERLLPRAEEPVGLPAPSPSSGTGESSAPPMPLPADGARETAEAAPPASQLAPQESASSGEPPAAAPSDSGDYVVQLAAMQEEAGTRAAFAKLQAKFSALQPLKLDVQKADLGEKGVFYRIRAGYLSETAAQRLCDQLKAAGQGCLVRHR